MIRSTHLGAVRLVGITLLFVLAACAGTRAAVSSRPTERWKVTWQTHVTVDYGGGPMGSYVNVVIATPTEIREFTEGDEKGFPFRRERPATPLDGERSRAISLLLPRLKGKAGHYSLSPDRGDEGFYGVSVTVESQAEVWRFELDEGSQDPSPPSDLKELYRLISGQRADGSATP